MFPPVFGFFDEREDGDAEQQGGKGRDGPEGGDLVAFGFGVSIMFAGSGFFV